MTSLFQDGALLPVGQKAEDEAKRFLSGQRNVVRLQDVRAMPAWQDSEVDYLITLDTEEVRGVEVKSDASIDTSGNVLFELMRIHHTSEATCAYPGWGVFSQAYYLLVYSPDSRIFRLFPFSQLRRAMQQYTQQQRSKTRISWIISDDTRSTLNLLIPLAVVPHTCYSPAGTGWRMEKNS